MHRARQEIRPVLVILLKFKIRLNQALQHVVTLRPQGVHHIARRSSPARQTPPAQRVSPASAECAPPARPLRGTCPDLCDALETGVSSPVSNQCYSPGGAGPAENPKYADPRRCAAQAVLPATTPICSGEMRPGYRGIPWSVLRLWKSTPAS